MIPAAVTMGLGVVTEILGIVRDVSEGRTADAEGQQLIRVACGRLKAADVGLDAVLAANDRRHDEAIGRLPEPVPPPMPGTTTPPVAMPQPTGES